MLYKMKCFMIILAALSLSTYGCSVSETKESLLVDKKDTTKDVSLPDYTSSIYEGVTDYDSDSYEDLYDEEPLGKFLLHILLRSDFDDEPRKNTPLQNSGNKEKTESNSNNGSSNAEKLTRAKLFEDMRKRYYTAKRTASSMVTPASSRSKRGVHFYTNIPEAPRLLALDVSKFPEYLRHMLPTETPAPAVEQNHIRIKKKTEIKKKILRSNVKKPNAPPKELDVKLKRIDSDVSTTPTMGDAVTYGFKLLGDHGHVWNTLAENSGMYYRVGEESIDGLYQNDQSSNKSHESMSNNGVSKTSDDEKIKIETILVENVTTPEAITTEIINELNFVSDVESNKDVVFSENTNKFSMKGKEWENNSESKLTHGMKRSEGSGNIWNHIAGVSKITFSSGDSTQNIATAETVHTKKPKIEDNKTEKTPEPSKEVTEGNDKEPDTQAPITTVNPKYTSQPKPTTIKPEYAEVVTPTISKLEEGLTYGMKLTGDHGIVWNNLMGKPGIFYRVGSVEADSSFGVFKTTPYPPLTNKPIVIVNTNEELSINEEHEDDRDSDVNGSTDDIDVNTEDDTEELTTSELPIETEDPNGGGATDLPDIEKLHDDNSVDDLDNEKEDESVEPDITELPVETEHPDNIDDDSATEIPSTTKSYEDDESNDENHTGDNFDDNDNEKEDESEEPGITELPVGIENPDNIDDDIRTEMPLTTESHEDDESNDVEGTGDNLDDSDNEKEDELEKPYITELPVETENPDNIDDESTTEMPSTTESYENNESNDVEGTGDNLDDSDNENEDESEKPDITELPVETEDPDNIDDESTTEMLSTTESYENEESNDVEVTGDNLDDSDNEKEDESKKPDLTELPVETEDPANIDDDSTTEMSSTTESYEDDESNDVEGTGDKLDDSDNENEDESEKPDITDLPVETEDPDNIDDDSTTEMPSKTEPYEDDESNDVEGTGDNLDYSDSEKEDESETPIKDTIKPLTIEDLNNNEQFWEWMSEWTSAYENKILKLIPKLVKEEVTRQLEEIFNKDKIDSENSNETTDKADVESE